MIVAIISFIVGHNQNRKVSFLFRVNRRCLFDAVVTYAQFRQEVNGPLTLDQFGKKVRKLELGF